MQTTKYHFSCKTVNKSYKNKDHEYERERKRKPKKRQCVHNPQIHTNKYIEHPPNKPTITSMRAKRV